MTFFDRALHSIDLSLWSVAQRFGLSAASYCDLETVEPPDALVTRDNSLCSILRLDGTSKMIGADNFDEVIGRLTGQLEAYLRQPAHRLQIVLVRDNGIDALDRELTEALEPSIQTARRLSLDLDDVLREKALKLASVCAVERAYLVAWTTTAALSRVELSQAGKDRVAYLKGKAGVMDGQRPAPAAPGIREAHRSLIATLKTDLQGLDYHVRLLSASEALRVIRYEIDPEATDEGWRASHPGDGIDQGRRALAPEAGQGKSDISGVAWPALSRQLIPRGIEPVSSQVLKIGNRLYFPVSLALPPAVLEPFSSLFQRLLETGIPYRISFRLSGTGVEDTEIRLRQLASVFSTSGRVRSSIAHAMDDHRDGKSRVGMQLDAVTWVDADDEDAVSALKRAGSRLSRAIQGWGGCDVDERMGSPVGAVLGTVPALRSHGTGVLSVPPFADAVSMLPVARPASPWVHGAMLFRTPDGKVYPYQPYSSEQASSVTLVYAPQGSGKSVALNALNLSEVVAPGAEELPYIAILDIGRSSSGMISLVREALPEGQRHLAQYRRLRMSGEDSLNPTDTPLGMRFPLPPHREFLKNFLTLLATPVGDKVAPSDVPSLVSTAIDEAYAAFADGGPHVRRYDRNVDPQVDRFLDDLGVHVDKRTTWWEVVDKLFEAGNVYGASLAQRRAMPLIGEIGAMAKTHKIAESFKGKAPNDEPITEYVYRALSQAVREYPILSRPTAFDLGEARIVSLDLAEVAPRGGPTADRQTAVMYMLARQYLAGKFFITEEYLQLARMPAQYRKLHQSLMRRMEVAHKTLMMDELHRASTAPLVLSQVEVDIREGRKANVQVVLASQLLSDFTRTMVDLATTYFVLGVGETSRADTLATFSLGPEAAVVLDRIGKPTSQGARLLGIFKTKKSKYTHELMLTLSPTEMWAFSTTAEDMAIRERLYRRIGPVAARTVLARVFPTGSAKEDIERRSIEMHGRAKTADQLDMSIIDQLVEELIREHAKQYGPNE